MEPDRSPRVIVGVDGSEASRKILAWAAAEAARLEAVLEIHTAFGSGQAFTSSTEVKEYLEVILEKAAAEATALEPNVSVKTFGHDGAPASALVQASLGADLLVVGSRGLGGFTGLLLGSVSQQCAMHAHCPVLIVRPSESRPPETLDTDRRTPRPLS